MRRDAFPLTYDESRARFRLAADLAGARRTSHAISARGPAGQELTVDVAVIGAERPARALVVLSGVHGVEGFANAAIQCDLLQRLAAASPPADVAVVVVHAVNPWGMAWWRRQNESNVDLNRNWGRDDTEPPGDRGYDAVHALLCPGGDELPSAQSFLDGMAPLVAERGLDWVTAAVTSGQYTHPEGLYFGGDRTEESTRIMARIVDEHVAGVTSSLFVDLHTGHGAFGTYTLLARPAPGSPGDAWLRTHFDPERIQSTATDPEAPTPARTGQLIAGMAAMLPGDDHHCVTFELGTVGGTRMILAERAEHWVHHHGDRADPAHATAVWEHRVCSTPDDPAWEQAALAHGRTVLDAALAAVSE